MELDGSVGHVRSQFAGKRYGGCGLRPMGSVWPDGRIACEQDPGRGQREGKGLRKHVSKYG